MACVISSAGRGWVSGSSHRWKKQAETMHTGDLVSPGPQSVPHRGPAAGSQSLWEMTPSRHSQTPSCWATWAQLKALLRRETPQDTGTWGTTGPVRSHTTSVHTPGAATVTTVVTQGAPEMPAVTVRCPGRRRGRQAGNQDPPLLACALPAAR